MEKVREAVESADEISLIAKPPRPNKPSSDFRRRAVFGREAFYSRALFFYATHSAPYLRHSAVGCNGLTTKTALEI